MSPRRKRQEERLPDELQDEQIIDLPSREALSIVDPGIFGVGLPQVAPGKPEVPAPATPENAEPPTTP
jgi:hypothetical protein